MLPALAVRVQTVESRAHPATEEVVGTVQHVFFEMARRQPPAPMSSPPSRFPWPSVPAHTDLLTKEKHFPADWLPKPETVRESVGPDETAEMAREIFQRWARKVREAAPTLHHG